MGFEGVDALDEARIAADLREDQSDLSPAAARSVVATLLADGRFSEPYCEWLPTWYELALIAPIRYGEWRLRRVAAAGVSGFRERFLLADALLHLEWFEHAATADGIEVPAGLAERTREESLSYYGGDRDRLSEPVRRFQRLLFVDDAWVRRVNERYGLDSRLFGVWERILRAERERLADGRPLLQDP